jgi:hypothetical protein
MDFDSSYSGITKMMDSEGPEATLSYLHQELGLQRSRLKQAEIDFNKARLEEQSARIAITHFAKACHSRNLPDNSIFINPNGHQMYQLVSVNKNQVIKLTVDPKESTVEVETFIGFVLERKEVSNG